MGCPESKPVVNDIREDTRLENRQGSRHVEMHENNIIHEHEDRKPEPPRESPKDFYELHPGFRNPEANATESTVSTDIKDIEKAEIKVLRVQHVNLNVHQNTRAHHTDEFDITNSHLSPYRTEYLVIRRGQTFEISLTFDRPYTKEQDDIKLVFRFGKRPLTSRGTHIELSPASKLEPMKWGAYIISHHENALRLHVLTPPHCYVGQWELSLDVVKKGDAGTTVYRYKYPERIYILFNPWCKDDQVYMPDTKVLQEYVLNETGKIFSGTYKKVTVKPWSFGQFTGEVLDCCMYILEKSKIPDHARGNPIVIARKISALVNSPDDNGVVVGNWSGDFEDGTFPLDWTGSVPILQEFYWTKKPVKYGQCWVFAGVLNTVCRALGIPARCVTNFVSAHDTNGSLTIDIHHDAAGNPLHYMDTDSIWNYHVWNDVWMARPDLPPGYGGWQAIDATPQETSEGIYCLGPTSLLAVKLGEVDFPYDGIFVFSEVNADKVYWTVGDDFAWRLSRIEKHSIGRFLYTKRAGNRLTWAEYSSGSHSDREDITHQYKYPEGTKEERIAMRNASQKIDSPLIKPESFPEDVKFQLFANDDALIGDNIDIVLIATNKSNSKRTLSGRITLSSIYYTGVQYKNIGHLPINDQEVESGKTAEMRMTVKPETYYGLIAVQCFYRISCMVGVKETKQTYTDQDVIGLRKPELSVRGPDRGTVGKPINVEVSFHNPLPVTLTNCELRVDAPGLQKKPTSIRQPNIGAKEKFNAQFSISPAKPGVREVIVYFTSIQISDVTGSHTIKIQ